MAKRTYQIGKVPLLAGVPKKIPCCNNLPHSNKRTNFS